MFLVKNYKLQYWENILHIESIIYSRGVHAENKKLHNSCVCVYIYVYVCIRVDFIPPVLDVTPCVVATHSSQATTRGCLVQTELFPLRYRDDGSATETILPQPFLSNTAPPEWPISNRRYPTASASSLPTPPSIATALPPFHLDPPWLPHHFTETPRPPRRPPADLAAELDQPWLPPHRFTETPRPTPRARRWIYLPVVIQEAPGVTWRKLRLRVVGTSACGLQAGMTFSL
jgi:hypothetical protein